MNLVTTQKRAGAVFLNDVHSQLNGTWVREARRPEALDELVATVGEAARDGWKISCSGGRHAMGGQQFGMGNLHLDLSGLKRVLSFDRDCGIVEVEAGIQWPDLIDWLNREQVGRVRQWGIRQKQTGADRLSIGGALAANVHGRGLRMRPLVEDVESFTLLKADGELVECSRTQNQDLFRLVIGGYGLFGIVYSVRLRLSPRQRMRRVVKLTTTRALEEDFRERIENGFLFGDFQFAIDSESDDFLRAGVFACYEPTGEPEAEAAVRHLRPEDWQRLLLLAHRDPTEGFKQYARYYLSTNGQTYWSDTQQLGYYCDDYHKEIDRACGCAAAGSEMITELYVPRGSLREFMEAARTWLHQEEAKVIYGTVRLIEADRETFLAWAREDFACVIFNLHSDHTAPALERSAVAFRGLIDIALSLGGSFYLTYHRYASKQQLLKAYPKIGQFLDLKTKHDPGCLFDSNWHRWLRQCLQNDFEEVYTDDSIDDSVARNHLCRLS